MYSSEATTKEMPKGSMSGSGLQHDGSDQMSLPEEQPVLCAATQSPIESWAYSAGRIRRGLYITYMLCVICAIPQVAV